MAVPADGSSVEKSQATGVDVQLAEPADTAAADGAMRRAKTDRADARKIRAQLADGQLPQSWIPPQQVLEMRMLRRLLKEQRDGRTP
jgi:transposase